MPKKTITIKQYVGYVRNTVFADNTFWSKTGKNAKNAHSACICSVCAALNVNYPPLMRGIPRLEAGASAPWSFSFPAYEESSLQDDCNHPNLTISTGDPRRPVRFIHNEGLSFLCVRMSGCACHPFRLIQDILCCLLIPVHSMSAYRAEIRPVGQF